MSTAKMLIDATHPEETRVVVLRNGKVEEFDYESAARKLLRGNIYLAKVTRVEPSLQAAFVEYGGNRHGFLAFSEIHPDYYQIPLADRQALLDAEAADEAEEERQADARADARANRRPQSGGDGQGSGRGRNDHRRRGGSSADDDRNSNDGAQSDQQSDDAGDQSHDQHAQHPADHTGAAAAPHDGEPDAPGEMHARASSLDQPHDPRLSEAPAADAGNGPLSVPEDPSLDEVTTIEDGGLVEDGRSASQPEAEVVDAGQAEEDTFEEVPDRRQRRRPRVYKIQEVIKKRQIILVQVVKEERGTKGAALTTYLSLAGRYTVLMPNTGRGGGISRKITNAVDRKRLKAIANELEVPDGMGLIIRTAGAARTKQEIKRDFEYLLRLWESVRELTLQSVAPSLVYEEGDLIKRSIRDLYTKDVEEIVVAGDHAYKDARDFMRMLMPSHLKHVIRHAEPAPIFTKYPIERQLNAMFSPYVHLKSGGYLVINQTEALVAIDINSGKSTREFSIEDTALNTNLEAADEIARQLKLRDLAGLIVVDFIDMEEKRNDRTVERRMKDALRHDRARIQVGRISHFGLLEMSRQRMRTGVLEGSTTQCPHCTGTGIIRSIESVSLAVLRGLEDAIMAGATTPLTATTTATTALYLLNNKRPFINEMEARIGMPITIAASDKLQGANFTVERGVLTPDMRKPASRTAVNMDWGFDGETAEVVADGDERPAGDAHESNLIEIDTEAEDDDAGEGAGSDRGRGRSAEARGGSGARDGGREERGGDGSRRRRGRRSRGGDRPGGERAGGERGPRDEAGANGQPPRGEAGARGDFNDQASLAPADDDDLDGVDTIGGDAEFDAGTTGADLDGRADDGTDAGADGRKGDGRRGRRRGRRGGRRGRLQDRPIGEGVTGAPEFGSDADRGALADTGGEQPFLGATGFDASGHPMGDSGELPHHALADDHHRGQAEHPHGHGEHQGVQPVIATPDRQQPDRAFDPVATSDTAMPTADAADTVAPPKAPRQRAPRGASAIAKREAEAQASAAAPAEPPPAREPVMAETIAPAPAAVPAPADDRRHARIAPVASEPVVASVVIGSDTATQTDTPKPARRGWWSRSTPT